MKALGSATLDRFLRAAPHVQDDDLCVSVDYGVAWQADRKHRINYDADYYNRCASYEGQPIADAINAGRIEFVRQHFGTWQVLDVGIGSGEFIKRRPNTFGFDVNPVAVEWLKRTDRWGSDLNRFGAITFWDVLEHVDVPERYFRHIGLHAYVFCSLPIFDDLTQIRASKHYRPGEHLTYWTQNGFTWWMHRHGFLQIDHQTFEIAAGREAIHSFAFKRNRWPTEYERCTSPS